MTTMLEGKMRDLRAGRPRDEDRAVEAWLRADLARRYDSTLVETLPQELLALLPQR